MPKTDLLHCGQLLHIDCVLPFDIEAIFFSETPGHAEAWF